MRLVSGGGYGTRGVTLQVIVSEVTSEVMGAIWLAISRSLKRYRLGEDSPVEQVAFNVIATGVYPRFKQGTFPRTTVFPCPSLLNQLRQWNTTTWGHYVTQSGPLPETKKRHIVTNTGNNVRNRCTKSIPPLPIGERRCPQT